MTRPTSSLCAKSWTSCWWAPTARGLCPRRPASAPRSWLRIRRRETSAWPASPATSSPASSTGRARQAWGSREPSSAGNAAATTVADLLEFYATDPATTVALAYMEGSTMVDRSPGLSAGWRAEMPTWSSRVDRPQAGQGLLPATPDRWPPTTAPSTACAARRASPGPQRSRRLSRLRPPSPHNRSRVGIGGRDDDRGRVGGRHRGCHHRTPGPRAGDASRRPARGHRRVVAAPVESQQPGRPGRRGDPRHHPGGAATDRRAPRRGRRHPPRPGHPVQPGQDAPRGWLLRHRRQRRARHPAHRRLPRAPGCPLRDRGSRDLERHGRTHPHRHGTRRCLRGQRGPAAVEAAGRVCYPSADRAVTALGHLARRARFLERRGL